MPPRELNGPLTVSEPRRERAPRPRNRSLDRFSERTLPAVPPRWGPGRASGGRPSPFPPRPTPHRNPAPRGGPRHRPAACADAPRSIGPPPACAATFDLQYGLDRSVLLTHFRARGQPARTDGGWRREDAPRPQRRPAARTETGPIVALAAFGARERGRDRSGGRPSGSRTRREGTPCHRGPPRG